MEQHLLLINLVQIYQVHDQYGKKIGQLSQEHNRLKKSICIGKSFQHQN